VSEYAISVIGKDRPGIVADVAEILAGLGLNLTDSIMTRLCGHFTMTLICVGAQPIGEIEHGLAAVTGDGALAAAVMQVDRQTGTVPAGSRHVLTMHGADRLGIVAAVARAVADMGGNFNDLTTRLTGSRYALAAELDLPVGTEPEALRARLDALAGALGVEIGLRAAER
jgi:glycine cleavage system transcriptional repressor